MFARKIDQTVWEIKCPCGQKHSFDSQGVDLSRVTFKPFPCDCKRVIDWEASLKWTEFLQGHWTREMPLRSGTYFLADSKRRQCGERGIVYLNPETNLPKSVDSWGGYWWSVPIPNLPSVPGEDDK